MKQTELYMCICGIIFKFCTMLSFSALFLLLDALSYNVSYFPQTSTADSFLFAFWLVVCFFRL